MNGRAMNQMMREIGEAARAAAAELAYANPERKYAALIGAAMRSGRGDRRSLTPMHWTWPMARKRGCPLR